MRRLGLGNADRWPSYHILRQGPLCGRHRELRWKRRQIASATKTPFDCMGAQDARAINASQFELIADL